MNIEYPKTYIAWDLETSGLHFANDRILEIGCAEIVDGQIVGRWSWIIKNKGLVISPEITAINGIDQALVDKEGISPREAFLNITAVLKKCRANLTHNGMRFDIPFLIEQAAGPLEWKDEEKELWRKKITMQSIDTAVMYKGKHVVGTPRMWNESFKDYAERVMNVIIRGKFNVGHCCDQLGVDRSNVTQHRALGDIELTHGIYQKLISA